MRRSQPFVWEGKELVVELKMQGGIDTIVGWRHKTVIRPIAHTYTQNIFIDLESFGVSSRIESLKEVHVADQRDGRQASDCRRS